MAKEIFYWVKTSIFIVLFSMFAHIFIIQPQGIIGTSMQPTFENHSRILVYRLSHWLQKIPDYNEIVVIDSRVSKERTLKDEFDEQLSLWVALFNKPTSIPHNIWIKRVIGKPGDTIEIRDGKVYRNGTLLNETYIKEAMTPNGIQKIVIPENHVFVMGDNINNSMDSRIIGPIPLGHVLGTMILNWNF